MLFFPYGTGSILYSLHLPLFRLSHLYWIPLVLSSAASHSLRFISLTRLFTSTASSNILHLHLTAILVSTPLTQHHSFLASSSLHLLATFTASHLATFFSSHSNLHSATFTLRPFFIFFVYWFSPRCQATHQSYLPITRLNIRDTSCWIFLFSDDFSLSCQLA